MIFPRQLFGGLIFILCLMLPATVFSDVKILLKNGRSITAESCKEKDGELLCFKAGGSFSITKAEIEGIKGAPAGASDLSDKTTIESPSGEGVPAGGPGAKKEGVRKKTEAPQNALQKRLGEINARKRELRKEGAKLEKEREQLKSDLSKAPDWMTEKRFAALSARVADVNKKIKSYNEEITRLDAEGNKIVDQLKSGNGGKRQP